MGENTAIAWCDATANFWWGCLKISDGCDHCYAETLSKRTGKNIWGPAKTTDREYKKAIWKDLIKWDDKARAEGKRIKVFVQSMSDFLEDHPQVEPWREKAKRLIEKLTNTDILMLTKRPENAERFLADWFKNWPDHVWFGVSVENQRRANERIPLLLRVPARILWLSVEPMLEKIDLREWLQPVTTVSWGPGEDDWGYDMDQSPIAWVVVGGESGSNSRPMDIEWARDLKVQCEESEHVAFFMKQIGGHPNKRDQLADFPPDLQIRDFPEE